MKAASWILDRKGVYTFEEVLFGANEFKGGDMFTGCGTALVTPFRSDGSLDEATLRALVDRQIDAGIDFLCPCGTTGESPTLIA